MLLNIKKSALQAGPIDPWPATPSLFMPASTSNKPRLAYLTSRYPAVSHTFILREIAQLRARGFDIDVASINPPDRAVEAMTAAERLEAKNTYTVKRHGVAGALLGHLWGLCRPLAYLRGLTRLVGQSKWSLHQLAYGFFYFTEALMLWRWMKAKDKTHLHVHFATAAANVALLLKHFAPITLSLTVHGPDEFYDAPGQRLVEKIAAADFIICIGSFARSQLMHISPAKHWPKFDISPLGVDLDYYKPHAQKNEKQHAFTVLCVGRLTSAKGQRILIEACRRLCQSGRDLRLVLIGDGPDEDELKAMVSFHDLDRHVIFTGPLNETEVTQWYAQTDIFALASFAEGIPVVLMEAMASGLPCVTTRITGIPELIRDGVDGLLVAPSEIEELTAALSCLIDDEDYRAELAHNGRLRVQQHFNITRNSERLAEVFETRLGAFHDR